MIFEAGEAAHQIIEIPKATRYDNNMWPQCKLVGATNAKDNTLRKHFLCQCFYSSSNSILFISFFFFCEWPFILEARWRKNVLWRMFWGESNSDNSEIHKVPSLQWQSLLCRKHYCGKGQISNKYNLVCKFRISLSKTHFQFILDRSQIAQMTHKPLSLNLSDQQ